MEFKFFSFHKTQCLVHLLKKVRKLKKKGRVKVTAKSAPWIPSVPHTEPKSTVSAVSEFIILELFTPHHTTVWSKFMPVQ